MPWKYLSKKTGFENFIKRKEIEMFGCIETKFKYKDVEILRLHVNREFSFLLNLHFTVDQWPIWISYDCLRVSYDLARKYYMICSSQLMATRLISI